MIEYIKINPLALNVETQTQNIGGTSTIYSFEVEKWQGLRDF